MQDANCDSNPATSDGIFVSLGERTNIVSVGDIVEVSGTVAENYGWTEISTAPSSVNLLSQGNPLPAEMELNPPFDNDQARAIQFLEGMLVGLPVARVVGPTNSRSNTWVIRDDLGLERAFRDDLLGTGEIVCVGGEGHFEIEPSAKVGDQIQDLSGVLGFSLGTYRMVLLNTALPDTWQRTFVGPRAHFSSRIHFRYFNLNNLFDWIDDPTKDDDVLTPTEYHRKLDKLALTLHDGMGEPAFIAVQEVENEIVLSHLLAREEFEAYYGFIWKDGPDTRSIDIAFVYRLDQVSVLGFKQRQGCTGLVDGFGPDSNRDIKDPQNVVFCDIDGDGTLDGNRLFSRPPLVVQLLVALEDGKSMPLWVIVNHWKSKLEDSDYQAYTLPRRVQQAQFVAALANEIFDAHPAANLIVLGDLNDFPNSLPLDRLTQARLRNVITDIPKTTRYTYIYQGVSQVLDYALIARHYPSIG